MIRGRLVADAVAIISSVDPVPGMWTDECCRDGSRVSPVADERRHASRRADEQRHRPEIIGRYPRRSRR